MAATAMSIVTETRSRQDEGTHFGFCQNPLPIRRVVDIAVKK